MSNRLARYTYLATFWPRRPRWRDWAQCCPWRSDCWACAAIPPKCWGHRDPGSMGTTMDWRCYQIGQMDCSAGVSVGAGSSTPSRRCVSVLRRPSLWLLLSLRMVSSRISFRSALLSWLLVRRLQKENKQWMSKLNATLPQNWFQGKTGFTCHLPTKERKWCQRPATSAFSTRFGCQMKIILSPLGREFSKKTDS